MPDRQPITTILPGEIWADNWRNAALMRRFTKLRTTAFLLIFLPMTTPKRVIDIVSDLLEFKQTRTDMLVLVRRRPC